jgi:hypothetical protein
MKESKIKRRDFLKSGIAGTLLAASPAVSQWTAESKSGQSNNNATEVQSKQTTEIQPGTIIRADMSQCTPAENHSRTFEANKWHLVEFETSNKIKGYMASARADQRCGELTLPLNIKGYYKIFVGIFFTKSHYRGSSSYGQLEVKLTDDAGFRRVGPEHETKDEDGRSKFGDEDVNIHKAITEAYWKTANLSGQSLTFRQMPYPYNRPEHARIANLTYVRLEPITESEKSEWNALQPSEDTRKLALIYCTGNFTGHTRGTYTFHPTDKKWFEDEFTPFVNSDFKIFIFEALRGNSCVFNTKIGSVSTKENVWQDDWVDPLAEFTRLAHKNDMKIFASMRFIGPQYPMNRLGRSLLAQSGMDNAYERGKTDNQFKSCLFEGPEILAESVTRDLGVWHRWDSIAFKSFRALCVL